MYLLDEGDASLFFAGDTGLSPDSHRLVEEHVHQAGRELDLALLPIGHAPWWKPGFRSGHLTWRDALTLWDRLRARYFIPYHWGTFHHVTSGPFDAIEPLRAHLEGHEARERVHVLQPGAAVDLSRAARQARDG